VSYEALSSMSNDGNGDGWRRRWRLTATATPRIQHEIFVHFGDQ